MLFRKIKKKIEDWLDNEKDALLITGARQVGKSYIIRETLKEKNVDFIELNFIKQRQLVNIFNQAIEENLDSLYLSLSVIANRTLKNNSIVFLDEVQECKEIVTLIKFLVEDGKFKYILSGSLLGVELTDLRSAPVGYLHTLEMFPLDLEEFYIANGLGQEVITSLRTSFMTKIPVNSFIHDTLINAFYKYLIVGGMPEAVETFITTNDFNKIYDIHMKIYQEYKKDFSKYEMDKKHKLISTYDLIPSELNSKNKRYTFSNLDKNLNFNRYVDSFKWLAHSGVALPVYNVTEFNIPLEASKKSNLFKLFLSDVRMLSSLYGSSTVLKILERSKDINYGSIFENAIAQELIAHGFKVYYFNNKKHGEVDFLIEYNGNLLPLEIKSGKDYQKHSALTYFMTTKQFNEAYVLSNFNIKAKDNIYYLPIYMIMFLDNHFKIDIKSTLDLSSLSKFI